MALLTNPFAEVPEGAEVTHDACRFVETVSYGDLPEEGLRIARRCVLDGLGLFAAGLEETSVAILVAEARDTGGREEVTLPGGEGLRVPASQAARVLGTAGHAHDWDDSQVSHDPDHIYGLLTHPTIPPLVAALAAADATGNGDAEAFLTAFMTGFEVESKLSEWMLPQHYKRGFHSSGTVGTFGAFAAYAKAIGLEGEALRHGFGIAASFAAGIRCNFGTMTKPLHVGRAAENGIVAARLAARGFTADPDALDGPWGFLAVHGGGFSPRKVEQGFGRTWSIVEPGVSIKPYPCGVLTHPTIDLMLRLVTEHDIAAEDIDSVTVRAGSNILKPIRYPIARNHLQAKFSLPAALSMIALRRQAGKREFSDGFVASQPMQDMQRRIRTELDPAIEALGTDVMRSRIIVRTRDGREIEGDADERYRGGPANPMSDAELEAKFRSCCEGVLDVATQDRLIAAVRQLPGGMDPRDLLAAFAGVSTEERRAA